MFYLIEVTSYTDDTKDARAIYGYETQLEAIGTFHQKMGGAMKNEKFKTELLTVIDGRGATIAHDYFEREVEEEVIPEEPTEPEQNAGE